jgi:hypothetical protein
MAWKGYLRAEESGFGGGDGRMFVPWTIEKKTPYLHYTFLSLKHIQAIFNQQNLVGPINGIISLSGLLWLGATRRFVVLLKHPMIVFLGLLSSAFFTLTVIWNPDLGAKRDWDLFAPSGFYLYLLAVIVLLEIKKQAPSFPLLWIGWTCIWINLCSYSSFFLYNRGL